MDITRQGDLDIFQIEALPKKLKLKKDTIVAYGEVTGHHHRLVALEPRTKVKVFIADDIQLTVYFEIKNGKAILEHQEHNVIEFNPGIYQIKTETEYDYFLEESRKVID